jgi:hypothetical protein
MLCNSLPFFKKLTPYVDTYIPSRFHEGYGLSEKALKIYSIVIQIWLLLSMLN